VTQEFKLFNPFNRYAELVLSRIEGFNPPFFIFPRDRGGRNRWGWNGLNGLNVLNLLAVNSSRLTPILCHHVSSDSE
jgi:hypothetical protein